MKIAQVRAIASAAAFSTRELAEKHCIKLACTNCDNGTVPTYNRQSRLWMHGEWFRCPATRIHEMRRKRARALKGKL